MLTRLRENDDAGWEQFIEKYSRMIFATALQSGLQEGEAEDAAQQVSLQVLKYISRFEHDAQTRQFKPWLLRIVRSCVTNELRRRDKALVRLSGDEVPEEPSDMNALFGNIWEMEWARNLLTMTLEEVRGEVAPLQYQLYDLYVLQEKPVREVVRKLKVSAASVYMAKYRVGNRITSTARRLEKQENARFVRLSAANGTYQQKFGFRNWQGGGRSSARETVGRVAAGAVAKKLLKQRYGVEVLACVRQVKKIVADINPDKVRLRDVEANIVRCPDPTAAEKMIRLIERTRKAGDTVGGIIEGIARGLPVGWGEPVFDRLEADLAKAMLSLPASKGFEIGSGFGGITQTGREHNDPMRSRRGKVRTTKNDSGGVQGGISNGETVHFRVVFKPVATVMHEQDTVDEQLKNTTLKGRGRHDPCVLPRAVPMVEAMTALVLADHALRHRAQNEW